MSLLDRHVAFIEALRTAGLPVSVAEDIDAARAVEVVGLAERERLRSVYAATVVKRVAHRPQFDAIFDLWFPPLIGDGLTVAGASLEELLAAGEVEPGGPTAAAEPTDTAAALQQIRADLLEAMREAAEAGSDGASGQAMAELAIAAVGTFGAMPGRARGMSSWSAYQALMRIQPERLVQQLVDGLMAAGDSEPVARRRAQRVLERFTQQVQSDALRRLAAEKGAQHVASSTLRPTIDRLDFLSARKSDLVELRREIYPLARRLATRLTQEHHAMRRGPLDFRRTVRASIATGGVPLVTHQRPKRPHRSELVVLCDVSGSVANFAQFTLLLVHALRDQFTKLRAFTFVDHVHEVTEDLVPGGDPVEVMERLAASASQAALWGRTNYPRAFKVFEEEFADAIGPRTSLLILGDARSNYADPELHRFKALASRARHAWWLNPEHPRNWGTGDSAAPAYAEIVPMVECRNLAQLGEFVHDIL
ncbi:VWA domain-containing protein [Nocardioides dubius]|uniref:VWA domain-containing protein n=1 Tax=Nocardioides dubius TaxID=317019 RepID=A0ABN1TTS1_9ACTN